MHRVIAKSKAHEDAAHPRDPRFLDYRPLKAVATPRLRKDCYHGKFSFAPVKAEQGPEFADPTDNRINLACEDGRANPGRTRDVFDNEFFVDEGGQCRIYRSKLNKCSRIGTLFRY